MKIREARIAEVTAYLRYKVVLDEEKEDIQPLSYNQLTVWRINWVVRQFWIQVLAVELKKMAKSWEVRLSWSTAATQADTGRCLVSIAFHWEVPFTESTAMDKI